MPLNHAQPHVPSSDLNPVQRRQRLAEILARGVLPGATRAGIGAITCRIAAKQLVLKRPTTRVTP